MKIRTGLKLYLVGLFILCPNILWAKFVPEKTARQVAVNSMNKNNQAKALGHRQKGAVEQRAVGKLTEGQITYTYTAMENDISVYYVFNFSPEGWMIISADDVAYPVIAYSESGFYDPNVSNQPSGLTAWMHNVALEISDAVALGLESLPDAALAWEQLSVAPDNFAADLGGLVTAQSVDPLIQSHWGQGGETDGWPFGYEGYSKYLPWEYTNWTHLYRDYCPTGCVATAMAQIMKYWQWPPFGYGSHEYYTSYSCSHECSGFGPREVNFGQQYYNWSASSMPLNGPSDAIALLMRDIGVAVEMNYTPSKSGADPYRAYSAFRDYFRYLGSIASRDYGGYTDANWIIELKENLDAGRPIPYYAVDEEAGGHAFICDGYDSSDYFHFNWGWEGEYDGYYSINDLAPGDHNFPFCHYAFVGIEPISEVYVDDNYSAGGDNEWHEWGLDAFNKIQDAILAVYPGGTVYVAAGTYYEAIDLKGKAIHLLSTNGPGVTTIDGNGAYHVVKCVTGEGRDTILEGFTITGGDANGLTNLEKCGGGMYNYHSSPTVTNCRFISNAAHLHGGGMHNEHSDPNVTNCIFSGNTAGAHGGGMMNNYGSVSYTANCVFIGNTANEWGGGCCNASCSPYFINCTFSGNTAVSNGGAIYSNNSYTNIQNCILWADSANEIVYSSGSMSVNYSDVQGSYSGTGNINADPCFIDANVGDLRLRPDSPCIDAGNNTAVPAFVLKDLAGKLRFADDPCTPDTGNAGMTGRPVVDMGAYEFQGSASTRQNLMANPGFEVGDATGWVTNWGFSLTADTNQVHDGNYSGLASNRTASWHGAWQSLLGLMDDGKTYRISGWVRLQNATSDNVILTVTQTDSAGAQYHRIDQATGTDDQWVHLDGTLALDVIGQPTELYVYFEGPVQDVNFYVDDAAVTEVMGDMNHNGGVDFIDFSLFASYYGFDCSTQDCGRANLDDSDNTINERDLAILCNNWLAGTEPEL